MRSIFTIASVLFGASVLFQKRYKILNALLAVNIFRKIIVAITMNMPYIRKKILPSILGRSV